MLGCNPHAIKKQKRLGKYGIHGCFQTKLEKNLQSKQSCFSQYNTHCKITVI